MKKSLLALTLFGAMLFTTKTAFAADIPIIYSSGQKIEMVSKLSEEAILNDEHVNLAVMYDQFAIFWIPVWNYGEVKYVLVNDKKDTYYDLEDLEIDIEMLKEEFDLNVPNTPSISFWNKIGGKIVWAALIGVIVFGAGMFRKKKKAE